MHFSRTDSQIKAVECPHGTEILCQIADFDRCEIFI